MMKNVTVAVLSIGLIGGILLKNTIFNSDEDINSSLSMDVRESLHKPASVYDPRSLTKVSTPDVLESAIKEDSAIENRDSFSGLTLAEQHEIAEWRTTLGSDLEQQEVYKNYDKETIFSLADQGDIYALQQTSIYLMLDLKTLEALESLQVAASLGSVKALYMIGANYRNALSNYQEGYKTEKQIREEYNIPESSIFTFEQTLEVLAAAHYMAPALRGDPFGSAIEINSFEESDLKRKIAKEDWPIIVKNANAIYANINERREQINADEFDNSYPDPYARLHGLPKENNMANKFCEYLQNNDREC